MDYTYRIAGLQDRDSYIDFINYVFSFSHCPHDFKALYPREYRDGFEGKAVHFLALDDAGKIRAVVAVLPFEMLIGTHRLSCGFVGSVSVHPYARGEGHMKKLMAMVNQWMMGHHLDLAVLDGNRQRYQYYGYSKGGAIFCYTVKEDNIRHGLKDIDTSLYRIEPVNSPDDDVLKKIHSLHSGTPVHVTRELSQIFYILTGISHRLYAVWKKERFVGYFSASKEASLSELLLSDASCYASVIKLWGNICQKEYFDIFVPAWNGELAGILDTFAEDVCIQQGGNIRIFCWERALPAMLALKQAAAGPLSDGHLHLLIDGQEINLRVEKGNIAISMGHGADSAVLGQHSNAADCFHKGSSHNGGMIPSIDLQGRIFSTGSLFHPQPINGEPKDWFPIPFSLPLPDHF